MKTKRHEIKKRASNASAPLRSLLGLVALALGANPLVAGDTIDLKTVTVKASAWEQKAHGGAGDFPPEATIDGSLAPKSSWRAEGDGQWIEYTLNGTPTLSGIQLAFFKGDSRQYRFEVQVSQTGGESDWRTVLPSRQSSGKSAGLEAHAFAPVAVRHLRIIGHGNTNAEFAQWINLLEVAFVAAPAVP